MLDLWHTFFEEKFSELPTNVVWDLPYPEITLAIVCVLAALIALRLLRGAFIRRFGRKYRALSALKKSCHFDKGIKPRYEYKISVNSRKQLERYDFDRFFLDEFSRNGGALNATLNSALKNEKQYRKYCAEAEKLLGVRPGDAARVRFLDPLEIKMCKRRLLKPITVPTFHCEAEYTSPKGQSHYSRSADYSLRQMEALGKQYQKNVEYQNSKAYQRSLMTASMRYDIMKRDHFRCVLCGRTAQEGAKLHVDHILPVAKGGLTVPENLRTLCDRCNLGKSDKYDPNGEN